MLVDYQHGGARSSSPLTCRYHLSKPFASTAYASRSSFPKKMRRACSVSTPTISGWPRCTRSSVARGPKSALRTERYRAAVRRKLGALHRHIQVGLIAQKLLQTLAIQHPRLLWSSFGSWLRTIRPGIAPSALVTAAALRNALPPFSRATRPGLYVPEIPAQTPRARSIRPTATRRIAKNSAHRSLRNNPYAQNTARAGSVTP